MTGKPARDSGTEHTDLKITSVRLPEATIMRLNRHAGRDREGRSGLIREAVERFLAELDRAA